MANYYLAADAAEIQTQAPTCPQRIRDILGEVADKHGLKVGDILGARRFQPVVRARNEAAWRCRQPALGRQASFPQIARWLDYDNHTSVIHAVRRHEAALVDQIEAPLTLGFVP